MRHLLAVLGTATLVIVAVGHAEEPQSLDQRVEAVLEHMRGEWRDLNIPEPDGRLLYEIVLQKGYKQALEVGTSTGRSALWIGWALSKTGGTLITLEIDETRHRQAKELFAEAGLGDIIDASEAERRAHSPELNVTADTPPIFFVHARNDGCVPFGNSVVMHEALRAAGVPTELHLYEEGGHGFGMGSPERDCAEWTQAAAGWLTSWR